MIHQMKLSSAPFCAIAEGKKDVEMRLHDEKRRRIQAGDIICFSHPPTGKSLCALVLEKQIYPDFSYIYDRFDKIRLGYRPEEEAHPGDMAQYYTAEEIHQYGAVALIIRVLPDE